MKKNSRNKWTKEEISILKKYYPDKEPSFVAKKLPNHSLCSIYNKAARLNVVYKNVRKHNPWTKEEIEILKRYYYDLGPSGIAKMLPNHKTNSVSEKANQLRLIYKNSGVPWSEEELNILKKYYYEKGPTYITKLLSNRPVCSVKAKARQLKLVYKYRDTPWSEEELNILKKYYPIEGTYVVNRLVNRERSTVKSKAIQMNIKFDRTLEPWTFEEDELVCNFYLSNFHRWHSNSASNELLNLLKEKGYVNHSITCLHMKMANYSFLHTGYGLSHPSKQSKDVYNRLK